jgi:hypothetical protein
MLPAITSDCPTSSIPASLLLSHFLLVPRPHSVHPSSTAATSCAWERRVDHPQLPRAETPDHRRRNQVRVCIASPYLSNTPFACSVGDGIKFRLYPHPRFWLSWATQVQVHTQAFSRCVYRRDFPRRDDNVDGSLTPTLNPTVPTPHDPMQS